MSKNEGDLRDREREMDREIEKKRKKKQGPREVEEEQMKYCILLQYFLNK